MQAILLFDHNIELCIITGASYLKIVDPTTSSKRWSYSLTKCYPSWFTGRAQACTWHLAMDKYKLHSREEEDNKNIVSKGEVLLLIQLMQAALSTVLMLLTVMSKQTARIICPITAPADHDFHAGSRRDDERQLIIKPKLGVAPDAA